MAAISGPHNCAQTGQNSILAAKAALLELCEQNGGVLSADEIEAALELLSNAPPMFDIYNQSYAVCVGTAHGGLPPLNPISFTRFALQAFCAPAAKVTFARQLKIISSKWLGCFFSGLSDYVIAQSDEKFPDALYQHYCRIAVGCGASLSVADCAQDAEIRALVGKTLSDISRADPKGLLNGINHKISIRLNLVGPSLAKVNHVELARFFDLLFADTEIAAD